MTPQIHPASSTSLLNRPALIRTGQLGLAKLGPSLSGQVQFLGALKRDQIQFGNDNHNNTPPAPDGNEPVNTDPASPIAGPTENGPSDETGTQEANTSETATQPVAPLTTWGKIKATARFLFNLPEHFRNFRKFFNSDNATLARGLFFKQVLPIIISLGAFIPVYGIPIAILGIPVSMISGRYGTSVLNRLKNKDNAQLSEPLKNIARIDEILGNPNKATSPTEIIDRINKAIDDALDIRKFPFLNRIVQYLRPTQNNFLGRILGQWQRFALLANININVAKEESIGKATYAGVKGGFQFLFWATLVPKVGMMLEKGSRFMPAPLSWICKGLGWLMEYAGLLRFAADLSTSPKPPASQPA
jgi:hypothetical protein